MQAILLRPFGRPLSATVLLLIASLAASQPVVGGLLLPRDPARIIDLTTFVGKTYLQTTLEPNDGIIAKTAADDATAVTISSVPQILGELGTFDPRVANNLYSHFNNGQADFQSAASHVAGQSLSPQQIQAAIAAFLPLEAKVPASDVILLTSGSGTVVELNPNDYFYNVSYQSPILSSGRSYGVTATRPLLGPTDTDYLEEMGDYLTAASSQEMNDFFTAMFKVLTGSDSSGVTGLSNNGQAVLTDFMAIYTAESMRHNMVNLSVTNAAWEIDLAEVTMVSVYVTASGMVMDGGQLVAGNTKAYSNGHSIGTHEADFTKLAKLITKYESTAGHHKSMITAINNLTPIKKKPVSTAVKGDALRRVMFYLNRTEFESGVQGNAAGITSAVVQLLSQIRSDQSAITAYVLKHE